MLPNWITQQNWVVQYSDGNRKPKEPVKPRLADAHEVCRLMNWDGFDQIAEAQDRGFPKAVRTENRFVNGAESVTGFYRLDRIQEWREQMAELINATLR